MFSEIFWKIEGTIGVVFVVSLIAINVAELIEQKNVLAIVSLALMILSAIILLILIFLRHDKLLSHRKPYPPFHPPSGKSNRQPLSKYKVHPKPYHSYS